MRPEFQESPILPSLSDLEFRKYIAQSIEIGNKISVPAIIPPPLLVARNLWVDCDLRKMSKEKIRQNITLTMRQIYSYFKKKDGGIAYCKAISESSDFANNMQLYGARQDPDVQKIMSEFCDYAILVSQKPTMEERELAFNYFPPSSFDLNCLDGTRGRLLEAMQNIKYSKGQKVIMALNTMVLHQGINDMQYQVDPASHAHIPLYLTYALGFESKRDVLSHDNNSMLPEGYICSEKMWEFLRSYRARVQKRVNDDFAFEEKRLVEVAMANYGTIKDLIESAFTFVEVEDYDQKIQIINKALAPLVYDDLKAVTIMKDSALIDMAVDASITNQKSKSPELSNKYLEKRRQEIKKFISDHYKEIEEILVAKNYPRTLEQIAKEKVMNEKLFPCSCDNFIEFEMVTKENLPALIRQRLIEQNPEIPILQDLRAKVVSRNQHHIDALMDYKILLKPEALDHLIPLLKSESEDERMIAIEALWVLGEKFKGSSPAVFLKLLEGLVKDKGILERIAATKSSGKSSQKKEVALVRNNQSGWFSSSVMKGWFIDVRNLFGAKTTPKPQAVESHEDESTDAVLDFLRFLKRSTPDKQKFKIERIAIKYRAFAHNDYDEKLDGDKARYEQFAKIHGLNDAEISLADLINFTYPSEDILKRIKSYPQEVTSLSSGEASILAAHPQKQEIIEVLFDSSNKKNLKAQFIIELMSYLAQYNETELCKYVLEKIIERNAVPRNLKVALSKALYFAARSGNDELVKLFLEKGANLDIVDDHQNNALMMAVMMGHQNVVDTILKSAKKLGFDLEFSNDMGLNALLLAVKHNQPDITLSLIKAGADLKVTYNPQIRGVPYDQENYNLLMMAVTNNCSGLIKVLIEAGVSTNVRDTRMGVDRQGQPVVIAGYNLLFIAAELGFDSVVKALIENDKDIQDKVNDLDGNSNDALKIAVMGENLGVVTEFLRAQKEGKIVLDLNRINPRDGFTPLTSAVLHDSIEMVRALLEGGAGADGNEQNIKQFKESQKQTGNNIFCHIPLIIAVRKGDVDMVKLLLKHGANPNVVDSKGLNLLEINEKNGNNEEIKNILGPAKKLQDLFEKIPTLAGKLIVKVHFDHNGNAMPLLVAKESGADIGKLIGEACQSSAVKALKSTQVLEKIKGKLGGIDSDLPLQRKSHIAFAELPLQEQRKAAIFSMFPKMPGLRTMGDSRS